MVVAGVLVSESGIRWFLIFFFFFFFFFFLILYAVYFLAPIQILAYSNA